MSQTEFSELTGIKQPMISVYLSGERSPSFRTFLKISKVCGSSFLGFEQLSRNLGKSTETCR